VFFVYWKIQRLTVDICAYVNEFLDIPCLCKFENIKVSHKICIICFRGFFKCVSEGSLNESDVEVLCCKMYYCIHTINRQ
jgi:hypothetical protein